MATSEPQGRDQLLAWFVTQWPSTIDIVGDFAGSELFLIHGESLLRHCLVESKVDFDGGFQLLHAVYAVENFLSNLYQRGCNFDVVFFQDLKDLCVPPGTSPDNVHKYQLARTVIIRHLARSAPSTSQDGNPQAILEFESLESSEFEDYFRTHPVHFLFCHEGEDDENDDTVQLRHLIYKFISGGTSVASVNSVEWRSSKVFAPLRSAASSALPTLDIENVFSSPHTISPASKAFYEGLTDVSPASLCLRDNLATIICKQGLAASSTAETVHAFLLHIAVLKSSSLQERQAWIDHDPKNENTQDVSFLRFFSEAAHALLENKLPLDFFSSGEAEWDLYDLVDGRAYLKVLAKLRSGDAFPDAIVKAAQSLGESVASDSLSEGLKKLSLSGTETTQATSSNDLPKVLDFSHPVLNDYLQDIKLDRAIEGTSSKTDVVFEDLNHWQHNKAIQSKKKPDKADLKAMKRHQRFMAEIAAYSASLTGSNGRMIDPETIVVSSKKSVAANTSKAKQTASDREPKEQKGKPVPKGKKPVNKGGRENALKAAQEVQERKAQNQRDTIVRFWRDTCVEMQRDPNLVDRYLKAVKFLFDRSRDDLGTLGSEVQLYLCHILGQIWAQVRKDVDKDSLDGLYLIAMEFNWLQEVAKIGATPAVADSVKKMNKYLSMPIPELTIGAQQQPLAFELDYKAARHVTKLVPDYRTLQLEHGGPYMDRRFDSQPDSRVPFEPDAWQRRVLDCIDIDHSLLVVAPTSAGKTFISFYAMKKVLEESDDAVLVYVAPTKALVNQVAAEVGARFSKSYHGKAGKSVWGIHTRDYRINSSTGCQILVTVPHILQEMLLSPTNASQPKSWSRRIKRIIFDEVHSIGQSEEGVIWEQLLLLAPCPIIALSATVGNPEEFRDWLALSQARKGYKMDMIVHSVRYSDLRKFIYERPEDFSFQGLAKAPRLPVPGLDEGNVVCPNFQFVHPVSVLTNRNRGALDDITLEARDCLTLWKHMTKNMPAASIKEVGVKDPSEALPEVIAKSEVLGWEANLKSALGKVMAKGNAEFQKLRAGLEVGGSTEKSEGGALVNAADSTDHVDKLFALACDLHAQDSLPAIVFNYDRDECERAAQSVMNDLKSAETEWKETSSEWGRKMREFERWKKAKESAPKEKMASRSKTSDGDASKTSKLEIARAEGSNEVSAWESFDPLAPVDEFSFADASRMQKSEFEDLTRALQYAELAPWLMEALLRGIGVHHAGMNRRYRQAVEILFRKGYLRLVVATGTLAMGINMPCKTVVFSGNSIHLTAQNFRQAAGRAGRRGFDLLGNVVFNGFTKDQVYEIMSSRLPDLRGQYPISATLVLRLFGLLHGAKNTAYSVDMVQSLLSHNRLYLGGPEAALAVKHHLRFSIEYLRRQQLLSSEGVPMNFSNLVAHLYFTENAVFAFHSLLKGGYFHQLCSGIEKNPEKVLLEMTLVLSHLFNRIPVQRTKGLASRVQKSTSVVFLPRLGTNAERMLMKHNAETLSVFKNYVSSFISHNLADKPDRTLPFTKVAVGKETTSAPAAIRSPFVALSGFDDSFKTIHELCSTVRGDIFLEESTIPYVPIWPNDTDEETNAYIYDFWRHGSMDVLVQDNMIKRSEVWFHLKEFAMTLATIVTSLENLIYAESSDPDAEEMEELHDLGEDPTDYIPEERAPAPVVEKKKPKKKAAVVQSWDDEDDEDEAASDGGESDEWDAGSGDEENEPAWQQSGGGLKNVLKAFTMLRDEFDTKFKKVWA